LIVYQRVLIKHGSLTPLIKINCKEDKQLQAVKYLAQNVLHQEVRQGECRWVLAQETFQLAPAAGGDSEREANAQLDDSQPDPTVQRSLLRHPGVAAIAPITANGEIILISQYRYTVGQSLWEIPAGTLHGEWQVAANGAGRMVATETPLMAAQRELQEEAGLQAARWEFIQQFYVMPGTSDGLIYLFAAFDLTIGAAQPDDGEVITRIVPTKIATALQMVQAGEICDAKTILAIQWAKNCGIVERSC
jgi:ADP-ribose pyrophosphatase